MALFWHIPLRSKFNCLQVFFLNYCSKYCTEDLSRCWCHCIPKSSPDFHFSCILTVFRGPREQIWNLGHRKISADTSVWHHRGRPLKWRNGTNRPHQQSAGARSKPLTAAVVEKVKGQSPGAGGQPQGNRAGMFTSEADAVVNRVRGYDLLIFHV